MASLSQLDVMTSSAASSTVRRAALQLPVKDHRDYDSWDDSSSVSSGISDGFDLDDIRGSSLHNINTPSVALHKDVILETETDCEKRGGAAEYCNARYFSGADMTDKSQHSSSGRKTPSIGQTGSWRRGMTAQVGVASPRSKTPQMINMTSTSLKTQGTAKTDDAKVSERSCLSPRTLLLHSPSSAGEEIRRPGSVSGSTSSRTATTSSLGFKKYLPGGGGSGTSVTSSGVTIMSGSATLGKLQHHSALSAITTGTSRCHQPGSMGRHRSVDDGCLSVNSRQSVLQYRSLPRPSRSHGSSAGNRGNNSITTVSHPAAVDIPGTGSRVNTNGTKRSVGSKLPSVNRTDRDKGGGGGGERRKGGEENGVCGEDSGLGGSGDSVLSLGSRLTRGKYPDVASTTLPRYGHLSPLRGEEPRDWLRSHSGGGVQEAGASSPSPSGTRFTYTSQLGSPTVGNSGAPSIPRGGGVANGLSNQETGSCDTLKSSNMSLDEKSRTISSSGSFRDGLEEVNGSSLSLVSSNSSVYSTTPEEKSQSEIRKLRRELDSSQEKVSVLTTQLNANSHLVAAFEQSLSNMTVRLQNLTTAAEQKDSELNELRRTIEELKKHNSRAQTAINTAINTAETCTPEAGSEQGSPVSGGSDRSGSSMVRQPSTDSVTSLTSVNSHTSRSSSLSSSNNDLHTNHANSTKKKTKNWLRSSFKQAFGKRRTQKPVSSQSDVDDSSLPTMSKLSSSQKKQQNTCPKASSQHNQNVSKNSHQHNPNNPIRTGLGSPHSSSLISECVSAGEEREAVMQLRSELRDKEMKLTDIRLEALSSAHQLDTLREAMTRMQGDMEALRQENMRLKMETQDHDHHHSLNPSQTPSHQNQDQLGAQSVSQHQAHFNHNHHNHNAYQNHGSQQSNALQQQNGFYRGGVVEGGTHPCVGQTQNQHASNATESTGLDMLLLDGAESGGRKEGRHVKVVVSLSHRSNTTTQENNETQFLIGCMRVSGRTRWDVLDGVVRRLFKEYLYHIDPVGQLGLSSDSVLGYSIADIHRHPGLQTPELLPCGYLVGDSDTISVCLKDSSLQCPDGLVFETLVPLPIMQHYISQLQEHRCVVLSGLSGTGKSFLAVRLAEHFVLREGLDVTPGLITTFSVGDNNVQEVHQSLCKLCEQYKGSNSGRGDTVLPLVVIVENLHYFPSPPTELINGLCNTTQHHCPYVIGTMSQTCPAKLQPQPSLSWIMWSSKEEPVKGFLGRFLRRQLLQVELSSRCRNPELNKVVDWLLAVWQHLDHFLDMHTSADVSIGPGLFLSCPMSVEASRLWFTRLWNYAVIPYCVKALRQLSDAGAEWEDPTDWVIASWPWSSSPTHQDLLHLCLEDVGFSSNHGTGSKTDPMVSKLQKLKDVTHCYHSNGTYDSTAEPAPESAI